MNPALYVHCSQQNPNKMEEKNNLERIPAHIRHYILEWKDRNMEDYLCKYGELKLKDMSMDQLHGLFSCATMKDSVLVSRMAVNQQ